MEQEKLPYDRMHIFEINGKTKVNLYKSHGAIWVNCGQFEISPKKCYRSEDLAREIAKRFNAFDALVDALMLHDEAAKELHSCQYADSDTQRKTDAALKLARGEA